MLNFESIERCLSHVEVSQVEGLRQCEISPETPLWLDRFGLERRSSLDFLHF